jgi:hypothetical protein
MKGTFVQTVVDLFPGGKTSIDIGTQRIPKNSNILAPSLAVPNVLLDQML